MTPLKRQRATRKAENPDYLRLDDQLCFPIYLASRLLISAYRPMLDDLGITYPQYLVLLVLWENDGLNVGAVGEKLHLDTGTLTPLLKRMEKQGLVTRKRCGSDDRVVENWLTDTARTMRRRAAEIPVQMLCNAQIELPQALAIKGAVEALVEKLLRMEGELPASGTIKRATSKGG
jgi:DNA-binding MarR family transcriptional regulator